jgi:hypothetical protein
VATLGYNVLVVKVGQKENAKMETFSPAWKGNPIRVNEKSGKHHASRSLLLMVEPAMSGSLVAAVVGERLF